MTGSAVDLSQHIATGQTTVEAVMEQTLARIDAVNPSVNALVSLRDPDGLMTEARAMDASPSRGWLHGIPIAIKDLARARGLPTSQGSPVFAGDIAADDDLYVQRLRAAGAIIIGKTNTPEFGLGSHTFNPVFGPTVNPYDRHRTCGGSSGGAAVALATGMLRIADGSDMMGSLRNPAAWNNVYGMRPSVGLIPSEPKGEMYLQHLSTNGPMARCPRDLAALLDTMAGRDPRQPFSLTLPASLPEIEASVVGRRIGWLGDWGGAIPFDDGILDLCETALDQLTSAGLQVLPADPPMDLPLLWQAWRGLRHFAVACGLRDLYEDPATRQRLKETAQWEVENGLRLSATDIHTLSTLRSTWYETAARLFETVDILALPSAQVWPFPIETEYPTMIAGRPMDTYHRWMEVVIPASLIGLPVVNIPIGFGNAGLPMGLQLIGPRGSDGRLLQVAQAWHRMTDWPNARPPVL